MAKKKVFSIGGSLSDGLEQTFAAAHNYSNELRVDLIPISKIETDYDNPRALSINLNDIINGLTSTDTFYEKKSKELQSLQGLANSIKEQGLINPILVYENNGIYKLIAGERRTLASALAKKIDIQAKILDSKPNELKIRLLQWIENIERSDLSLKERMDNLEKIVEAFALQNHISPKDVRITDISQLIGCVKSHAINLKLVLNADDDIKQLIAEDKIKSLEKAALLCSIELKDARNKVINAMLKGASLKQLKLMVSKKVEVTNSFETNINSSDDKLKVINLGHIRKVEVAQVLLNSLFRNSELLDLTSEFTSVDLTDPHIVVKTFKTIIKKLECIYA